MTDSSTGGMLAPAPGGGESGGRKSTGSLTAMGPEIYLVVGVIVLLFGGSQLPKLARSLGQAKKEFESGQNDTKTTTETTSTPTETKTTKITRSVSDDDQA
jgi:sec-independent protein translocase protein TatA